MIALPGRRLAAAGLVFLALFGGAAAEVDTEHMFGFTEGSDIGAPRQLEAEIEEIGHFGREGGTYSTFATNMNLKYPLTESFRIAGGLTVTRFDSYDVTGVANINAFVFDRITAEFRWRPLDRETSPLGLTFMAAPFYGFIDDVSGQPASAFGATLLAIADRELIHERLFGAVSGCDESGGEVCMESSCDGDGRPGACRGVHLKRAACAKVACPAAPSPRCHNAAASAGAPARRD